ncbi:hypothetical protein K502DRAFT_324528 [Neoconidiobolus thromboides FSU 785]|nr:hypothetical protein K502DRAFT_324528 [Neoconidiobolus thromboides FSU 785]
MSNPTSKVDELSTEATLRLTLQNEINELMGTGIQYYQQKKFEASVTYLSQGVALIEQVYGPVSLMNADALVKYGRALLENAVMNTAALGDKKAEESTADNSKNPDSVKVEDEEVSEYSGSEDEGSEEELPDMRGKFFSFGADMDLAELENEQPEENRVPEQEVEEEDDFSLAWQALDSARVIYEEYIEKKESGNEAPVQCSSTTIIEDNNNTKLHNIRVKLFEVYLILGDVSLESENFEQALNEYRSAVVVQYTCLEPHDRRFAEAHYKIAVAYEYLNKTKEAKEVLSTVLDILDSHIETLNENQKEEIIECKQLTKEINDKIADLDHEESLPEAVTQMAKEIFAKEFEFQGPQENAIPINQLVKRKLPTNEDIKESNTNDNTKNNDTKEIKKHKN